MSLLEADKPMLLNASPTQDEFRPTIDAEEFNKLILDSKLGRDVGERGKRLLQRRGGRGDELGAFLRQNNISLSLRGHYDTLNLPRSSARKLCLKLSPLKMVLDAFGRGLRAAIRAAFTAEYLGGVFGRSIYLGGVFGRSFGRRFGRSIWAAYLGGVFGRSFGRSIRAEYLGGVLGQSIWAEYLGGVSGGVFGRSIWAAYLGGVFGRSFGRSIRAEYLGGVFGFIHQP
ncbi:unnamed protein product [Polarella glacialis]|uniref:Uncharacterized protein n=1 Tax=Polarella glacialis TaxID=89957 RepID=A0A813FJM9_POLGL|nr:unnamed protein product [Polarella glacialis]